MKDTITITVTDADLSKAIGQVERGEPINLNGEWNAHFFGDCPMCGGPLAPTVVTEGLHEVGGYVSNQWSGLLCKENPMHALEGGV